MLNVTELETLLRMAKAMEDITERLDRIVVALEPERPVHVMSKEHAALYLEADKL